MLELFAYLFLLLGYGLLWLKVLLAQPIVPLTDDLALACVLGLALGWRIVSAMMA